MHLFRLVFIILATGLCSHLAAQKNYNPGDIVTEGIEASDTSGNQTVLKIPDGNYLLVFRYRWVDVGRGIDNADSIKLLEDKIAGVLLGGMVGKLRIVFLSYDQKPDYNKWMEKMKKERPLAGNPKYKVEYYNLNGNIESFKKCQPLFTKLNLFGPDGKLLKFASGIGNFYYHSTNTNITLKAKLLTESGGTKIPLLNALVHIAGKKNDTIAKARTDKFGDFELSFPNSDQDYKLNVNPDDAKTSNVLLLTREGREISKMEKTSFGFGYKLLNADIVLMSEIESEDITMRYEMFVATKNKELITSEAIFYEVNKSDIKEESKIILDKIVKILNDNPAVSLEVISHTDAQGDDKANMALSEKRAAAVTGYLTSKGIASGRLKSLGKGESQIRNRCFNGVLCSDIEHGYNRRTEFKFTRK
jgi:outer membrane protein OmpA-like peptidoglycan-associated protein